MQTIIEEQALKIAEFNGIEVYRIKSGKFKTNSINFFYIDRLTKENAAKNALLPAVLRRGCKSFPTLRDIAMHLEGLYGASFDCGVTKKGEQQIMQFYTDFLSDTYAEQNGRQFDKLLELIFEIITAPVLENGIFKEEYLAQEKENLRKLIEGRVNDKMQYSLERCFEEMCSNEPFGIYDYGTVKDVQAINAQALYRHYGEVLETYPLKVYLSGDIDEKMLEKAVNRLKTLKRGNIREVRPGSVASKVEGVRNTTERMSVNQSKLCLGFRTNIPPWSEEYYALMVCNGILGGGIHSKLFQNVREKAGLAYYVFSRLEKFKGLMLISSGIEAENRDKTIEIVLKQLDDIRKGLITDYEYDATVKSIENGVKSMKDSQMQIVDFYLSQGIAGTADTMESITERVKRVGKEDIIRAAESISLDTIYFLTMQA